MIDHQGWMKSARHRPSPNYGPRPDPGAISLLVIHNISLPPGSFGGGYVEQFFCNELDLSTHPYFAEIAGMQVSAHLYIERQGEVTQFVSLLDRAWHAGESQFCGRDNCNDFSIGIELEGCDLVPYTDNQYRSLVEVTRELMHSFPDLDTDRIVGHSEISPGRKTDPGEAFDWQRYRLALRGGKT